MSHFRRNFIIAAFATLAIAPPHHIVFAQPNDETESMGGPQVLHMPESTRLAEQGILRPVPVEITENKKQFKILADLHGFKPEEVEVCIKDNVLILSGENDS